MRPALDKQAIQTNTSTRKNILLIGDINIDVLMSTPDYPDHGSESLTDRVDIRLGGSITNTAVVLSKLGYETALISRIGRDVWGNLAGNFLTKCGIKKKWIDSTENFSTGLNFIVVTPDDERTMFGHRGANATLSPGHIDESAFNQSSMLHISGYALMESPQRDAVHRAIELAKLNNVPISLDTAYIPVMQIPQEFLKILPDIQICILGMAEASQLLQTDTPEEASRAMLQQGIKMAAIKLGRQGCHLQTSQAHVQLPAFMVDSIDSTGAGDAFSAGIIFGWLTSLNLTATGIFANTLGALATTIRGGGVDLPGPHGVLQHLAAISAQKQLLGMQPDLDRIKTILEAYISEETPHQ